MRLRRGRRRKSSGPRISNQRSSTGCTFVKKRWPPMSNRQPSRIAVRLMPPTTVSDSRTVDVTPRLVSMYAAVRPAGPAPMMTTLGDAVGSVVTQAAPSWRLGRDGRRGCVRGPEHDSVRAAAAASPTLPSGYVDPDEREDAVPHEAGRRDDEHRSLHVGPVA